MAGRNTYQIKASNGGVYEVQANSDEQAARLEKYINRQIAAGDPNLKSGRAPDAAIIMDPAKVAPEERPTSFVQGVGEGVMNVVNNVAGWTESGLNQLGGAGDAINQFGAETLGTAPSVEASEQWQQQRYDAQPVQASGLGTATGELIASLPATALRGGALVQGAVSGALMSEADTLGGVAVDAGLGAVGGKVGELGMRAAARVVSPVVGPAVQRLLGEGVRLTPGQIVGQGGPVGRGVKKLEDIAAKAPVVGGVIEAAQQRGVSDLRRAAINRTLTPIGDRLPPDLDGHEAVAFAGDRLRDAYGDVLPRLRGQLDRTFETRINAIRARANLPAQYDEMLGQAQAELGNAFQRSGPNGTYNGRTLRDASERLEDLASGWRRSDDPYTRMVGETAEQMRQQLHALARRQNPQQSARLRSIDRGYASLVRVEKAALSNPEGLFSPTAYNTATRTSDRSARRRQSARGEALDQDLSSAAATVMPNTAAMGGSKDTNSLLALGSLGLGLTSSIPGVQPAAAAALAGMGLGSAAYLPGAQDAARYLLARPTGAASQRVSDLIRQGSRYAPVPSAALVTQPRE